jgi:sugar/nucleoside kinase (ribokinase family)
MRRIIDNGGAELVDIFRRAKATGVTTSLDMCMPDPAAFSGRVDWRLILSRTLPYVDIFMPSLEETVFMLRSGTFLSLSETGNFLSCVTTDLVTSLGSELLEMGPKVVGLKLGHLGLYLRTADKTVLSNLGRGRPSYLEPWSRRELWALCFETNVIGTTGAGDTTVAGFLAALLRDFPPDDAAIVACGVGGCSVESADAVGGIHSWEETLTRIAKGWNRKLVPLQFKGWTYDSLKSLWYGPNDSSSSPIRA